MFASTQISAEFLAPFLGERLDKERAICFGPFRLLPTQRLLMDGDKRLHLGGRALDVLIALVERPGELVSKQELIARVWPNTFVDPANLTVHIAALRRTLGDGRGGNRFLINIPGRGYRFVAPIKLSDEFEPATILSGPVQYMHNLPAHVTPLIGREDAVTGLSAQLHRDRLLTIVGTGGIGKTAVALVVAEKLIPNYRDGVWLIDLAPVYDPLLVPVALASALRLEIHAENPLPELMAFLREREMLLVLDNCEHLVAAAASVAAGILRGAPNVHVLATSREPLRTEGERVYRLPPLQSPPVAIGIGAKEALAFPAVQLFAERTAAALGEFVLSDSSAPAVADICLKLDGLPLAIEFAAARVGFFGIRGLAARLDDRLDILNTGSRTKLPRQRSIRPTLDWSYGLLTEAEQKVLRRLSIFPDNFTLRTAGAVSSDGTISGNQIINQITELVAKSFVDAEAGDAEPRLRLMETTRVYALAKLAESGELDTVARRHAEYFANLLPSAVQDYAA
jgi:predicted ATPase/DNA-binding winged helix-turn-helix (wHTH) protein